MDVRQLLQLAGDNSAIAKKKVDRLSTKSVNDEPIISDDAVAAYLSKKKKFTEKLKAQEDAARKKRIQARLDASLGKPTRKEKKKNEKEKAASGHFLPTDKRSEDVKRQQEKELKREQKEKEEKLKRAEEKAKLNHKRKSKSPECPPVKKKVRSEKDASALKKQSVQVKEKEKTVKVNHENTHRKHKHRTEDRFESSITYEKILNEKQNKNAKTAKEKNNKNVNNAAPAMSFTDLLKQAKINATTTRISEDGNLVKKKKEKPKTFDEEHGYQKKSKSREEFYEPPPKAEHVNGIDHKEKKKEKLHTSSSEKYVPSKKPPKEVSKTDKPRKDKVQNDRHPSKHKHSEYSEQTDIRSNKHKHDNIQARASKVKDSVKENKYSGDSPPPVKRGLIAQTISTKKNGNIQPPGKISKAFKQVKPGKPSGIEMQYMNGGHHKQKMKRPAVRPDDGDKMEDELDKEMRMLARKRKLFEMKRVTGNTNLNEEDIESDIDYNLSEEDESDDNFIDDSEYVGDVSKHIRRITGYDRRMYDGYDDGDDPRDMESSYTQIEKEEARSSRIGREEDRIEALKEAEELARAEAKEKERLKKKKR